MSDRKRKKELNKMSSHIVPVEIDRNSTELRDKCISTVFKDYLPYVSKAYKAKEFRKNLAPTESVACFDITKFVLEKNDNIIDKLKNVYHLIAYSDNSIALILERTKENCRISLAVGTSEYKDGQAIKTAENVRDAFLGNFPGSECDRVVAYDDKYGSVFDFLNSNLYFNNPFSSVGIVSNIASDYSEDYVSQGIEKLLDGIRPIDGAYTIVILGEALSGAKLKSKKEELYNLYTAMSPFAKRNKNWGIDEGKNWSTNWNIGLFGNAAPHNPIKGIPVIGEAGGMLGVNANFGMNKGENVSVSKGESIEITQYDISHTLEVIDKQANRLEECEALGLWNMAAYVFSLDYNLVNEVSHMYMSLTQGEESYYEKASVNVWNANAFDSDEREQNRNDILNIKTSISYLRHPQFVKKYDESVDKYQEQANYDNWPHTISCTSSISGSELTRAMCLPRKSVPGIPVIECAPFGREISSYDKHQKGDIYLGVIHHMHSDEQLPVELNSDSITSHVFVTGSTGSGKSNTVYKLLENANKNFLVVEPTKGEYRYVFGKDVHKFGTNHMMGDVLRINPFVFPKGIHVYEHIDRILEVFNVCWPMYAAMPAVLKDAFIRAYERVGWDLRTSVNSNGCIFPTFYDVVAEIDNVIELSDYSDENKGNYKGSLKTRLKSLTNGINSYIFCEDNIPDEILFDSKTIVDLSRIGSQENKALTMGVLVIKLQEYRMCRSSMKMNEGLKHITVLEEAHHLLKNAVASSSPELVGGIAAKSVEMLSNAIAEMRTYGEGFVIVDQAPGLMDKSVIRNTNTKIIMRLPDQDDRELVGRAANLNDEQIQELAKLQRGVAVIYQNEWIEPVLCHIHKFTGTSVQEVFVNRVEEERNDNSKYLRYLNSCIYDPNYLVKKSDISFVDCIEKLNVPSDLKFLMHEYISTPIKSRRGVYKKLAYRYFNIQSFLESENHLPEGKNLDECVIKHLKKNYIFMDDTDFIKTSITRQMFVQIMLEAYVEWASNPERTERIEIINSSMG